MDEYAEYIYQRRPEYRHLSAGDTSTQKELRSRLHCKNFKWFMSEVAWDLPLHYPPVEPPAAAWGQVRAQLQPPSHRPAGPRQHSMPRPEYYIYEQSGERIVRNIVGGRSVCFFFLFFFNPKALFCLVFFKSIDFVSLQFCYDGTHTMGKLDSVSCCEFFRLRPQFKWQKGMQTIASFVMFERA